MRILVTGAAGFIGFHLAARFLAEGHQVVGLDNLNDYYSVHLKQARLAVLARERNFSFAQLDLAQAQDLMQLFSTTRFDYVVNLAAQAGVRHSIEQPHTYAQANLVGFLNLLEACRHYPVQHLLFASSSSVYGLNSQLPFSENDNVDHPVSLYAATKKSGELMAHAYAHLYNISCTGLRFFTVYGPWGRPDMALFLFTDAILHGRPIKIFNNGQLRRDFTYINDIVEATARLTFHPATPDPAWHGSPSSSSASWRIYNIGNNHPIELMHFIETLEDVLGQKATKEFLPMQSGDVEATAANIDALQEAVDFYPRTSLRDGLTAFVQWYHSYYSV